MAVTYPPPPPTQVGETTEIHQLLQTPELVQRRVRDLSLNRFIADVLLPSVLPADAGSVAYEQGGESQFTERDVEIVRPGQEYPRTPVGIGPQQIATVAKWGQDVPVTDEAIKNTRMSPVDRAFRKIVNQNVRKIDSISLAAIASTVTNTIAATTSWLGNAPLILRDALKAIAAVRALDEGFELDTLVVDDLLWAYIASDEKIAQLLARENSDNAVYSGNFPSVAGLRLLPTNNLPPYANGGVLAVDSTQLGGMADQDLGGGYQGALRGVQTKTIRQDETDRYLLRGRRVTVPVVLEPGAGIVITGARS